MSIIRTISLGLVFFIGTAAGSPAPEEKELADDLMKQLVGFSRIALEEMDPAMPGVCYAKLPNEHNQTPCYPLAYLYKTKHPLNPRAFPLMLALCHRRESLGRYQGQRG